MAISSLVYWCLWPCLCHNYYIYLPILINITPWGCLWMFTNNINFLIQWLLTHWAVAGIAPRQKTRSKWRVRWFIMIYLFKIVMFHNFVSISILSHNSSSKQPPFHGQLIRLRFHIVVGAESGSTGRELQEVLMDFTGFHRISPCNGGTDSGATKLWGFFRHPQVDWPWLMIFDWFWMKDSNSFQPPWQPCIMGSGWLEWTLLKFA